MKLRYKTVMRMVATLGLISLIAACGTPEAIKNLSTQQLNAQQEFKTALTTLFLRMEEVVANQIKVIEQNIDDINRQRLQKGANLVKKNKITPVELTSTYISETKQRNALLSQANQKLRNLKTAHKNMLVAFGVMVNAQRALDEYLRLERADEKIVNNLLAAVGVSRKRVTESVDLASSALTNAQNFATSMKILLGS